MEKYRNSLSDKVLVVLSEAFGAEAVKTPFHRISGKGATNVTSSMPALVYIAGHGIVYTGTVDPYYPHPEYGTPVELTLSSKVSMAYEELVRLVPRLGNGTLGTGTFLKLSANEYKKIVKQLVK